MIENLREDFLQREIRKLCGESIPTENLYEAEEVTSPVIYTQHDYEMENGMKLLSDSSSPSCTLQEKTKKVLNEYTTTMFAANPQLILPSDEQGNPKMDLNFSRQEPNTPKQDSYLHLVLPAKDINILNPTKLYS